jgi:hypothetical protein
MYPKQRKEKKMAPPKLKEKCYACGKDSNYSILLAITGGRIYLPNQAVRAEGTPRHPGYGEVAFCASCMRTIEDNLRATILYIQSENEIPSPSEP